MQNRIQIQRTRVLGFRLIGFLSVLLLLGHSLSAQESEREALEKKSDLAPSQILHDQKPSMFEQESDSAGKERETELDESVLMAILDQSNKRADETVEDLALAFGNKISPFESMDLSELKAVIEDKDTASHYPGYLVALKELEAGNDAEAQQQILQALRSIPVQSDPDAATLIINAASLNPKLLDGLWNLARDLESKKTEKSSKQALAIFNSLSSATRPCYASCLLYTSPSPRDRTRSRMPSSA